MCSAYRDHHCDGLFVTAVSNLGVRLPVRRIVRAIEERHPLNFVVVDGAQEFCHTDTNLGDGYCDLYLAGCHKWLRAHLPMGIMFCGRKRSKPTIERAIRQWTRHTMWNDPLMRFSQQLEANRLDDFTETVNVAPLFSTFGALSDVPKAASRRQSDFMGRIANAVDVARVAIAAGWRSLLPKEPFRTGILLLQSKSQEMQDLPSQRLRDLFHRRGIAITTYDKGLLRLSMPARRFLTGDLDLLCEALVRTA